MERYVLAEKRGSMQLQITTSHAIRILQHLHRSEEICTMQSIAKAVGITAPQCTRIMARLKRDMVVRSPGRGGGYRLKRPAEEISFYDVFLAVEGELYISPYLNLRRAGGEETACRKTEGFLEMLQGNIIEDMLGVSIADLVGGGITDSLRQ